MADPQETPVLENDPAPTNPPPTTCRATTPPARLPYTRHATAGTKDDRIVNPAWYLFLIVMLVIGGVSFFGWLVYGGYLWGSSGCYTCYQNQPVVAAIAAPSQKPALSPPAGQTPKTVQPMTNQVPAAQPPVALQPQVIQLQLSAIPAKIQVEADVSIKAPTQPVSTVQEKPRSIWDQPGNR